MYTSGLSQWALSPMSVYQYNNIGELNEKNMVVLPQNLINNFDNGYYIGEVIRKIYG